MGGNMNRKLFGALVLLTVALVVNVNAQQKARAEVPFNFIVGGKALPAATYNISEVGESAMALRDGKGDAVMFTIAPADAKHAMHNKLVFHQYGDRYFLYQVWDADGQGIQLHESKLEREQASAQYKGSAPQEVVLALR